MTDNQKQTTSNSPLKPLLWVALGIMGTVLAMFAFNDVPQDVKDTPETKTQNEQGIKVAIETQAQKEQRLAEAQRQADEALLQSGQWRDPATNLVWSRCSLGQTWSGNGCDGKAKELNWWDAHQAALNHSEGGHSDWRLPTTHELARLMAGTVRQGKAGFLLQNKDYGENWWNNKSAAEQKDHQQNYFYSGQKGYVSPKLEKPNSDHFGWYWSSSPYVGDSNIAWGVDFRYGHVSFSGRQNFSEGIAVDNNVRLVRAGLSLEGGNAALLAFEQKAKNIYQDQAEYKRQEELHRQQEVQREAEARRERFLVGDTAYVCAGTILGENSMCKTEVMDISGDRIKVVYQTQCNSIAHQGYVEWVSKNSAGTVDQVRAGLRCN